MSLLTDSWALEIGIVWDFVVFSYFGIILEHPAKLKPAVGVI